MDMNDSGFHTDKLDNICTEIRNACPAHINGADEDCDTCQPRIQLAHSTCMRILAAVTEADDPEAARDDALLAVSKIQLHLMGDRT